MSHPALKLGLTDTQLYLES